MGVPVPGGKGYGSGETPPPGASKSKVVSDLKKANQALDMMVRDDYYIGSHCEIPGRFDSVQSLRCNASFDRSDPRALNVGKDAIAFRAALEVAKDQGFREYGDGWLRDNEYGLTSRASPGQ